MFDAIIAALLFVGGVVLLIGGGILLGVAGWWFARAVREAHTARAHAAQADETTSIIQQATDALEEVRPAPRAEFDKPSDDELMEIIRSQREHRAAMDNVTTTGNEGFEEVSPTPGGAMYRGQPGFDV